MNAQEHFALAEDVLRHVTDLVERAKRGAASIIPSDLSSNLVLAQVHASLALAAATMEQNSGVS